MAHKSALVVYRLAHIIRECNGLSPHSIEKLEDRLRNTERRAYLAIARELGMTIKRFLEEETCEGISEWIALFKIEQEERETNTPELDQRARRMSAGI